MKEIKSPARVRIMLRLLALGLADSIPADNVALDAEIAKSFVATSFSALKYDIFYLEVVICADSLSKTIKHFKIKGSSMIVEVDLIA